MLAFGHGIALKLGLYMLSSLCFQVFRYRGPCIQHLAGRDEQVTCCQAHTAMSPRAFAVCAWREPGASTVPAVLLHVKLVQYSNHSDIRSESMATNRAWRYAGS